MNDLFVTGNRVRLRQDLLILNADLVPAGDGQGDGVVAVGDCQGGSFQAAHPADEAA